MKIQYRKPTLVEQMTEAIDTAKKPIEAIVLTPAEFQSVINYLDKSRANNDKTTYSFKGVEIKVNDE